MLHRLFVNPKILTCICYKLWVIISQYNLFYVVFRRIKGKFAVLKLQSYKLILNGRQSATATDQR